MAECDEAQRSLGSHILPSPCDTHTQLGSDTKAGAPPFSKTLSGLSSVRHSLRLRKQWMASRSHALWLRAQSFQLTELPRVDCMRCLSSRWLEGGDSPHYKRMSSFRPPGPDWQGATASWQSFIVCVFAWTSWRECEAQQESVLGLGLSRWVEPLPPQPLHLPPLVFLLFSLPASQFEPIVCLNGLTIASITPVSLLHRVMTDAWTALSACGESGSLFVAAADGCFPPLTSRCHQTAGSLIHTTAAQYWPKKPYDGNLIIHSSSALHTQRFHGPLLY